MAFSLESQGNQRELGGEQPDTRKPPEAVQKHLPLLSRVTVHSKLVQAGGWETVGAQYKTDYLCLKWSFHGGGGTRDPQHPGTPDH